MSKELLKTIIAGDIPKATQLLLTNQYDVEACTSSGQHAFHLAIRYDAFKLLPLLVKFGFNVNAKTKSGLTPLHYAALLEKPDACQFLIKNGANHSIASLKGNAPLHLSVIKNTVESLAITSLLLNAKANINAVNNEMRTPLHQAVLKNSFSQVRLLVQNKADVDAVDDDELTPLEYAQDNEYQRIETFLEKSYNDSSASDTDSEDAINYQLTDDTLSDKKHEEITYSADFLGEDIDFEEQRIAPNGDCAFIGLGTTREALVSVLKENSTNELRESIWYEVAEAILSGDYKPLGYSRVLAAYFSDSNTKHPEPLKTFCLKEPIFKGYLDKLKGTLWLGYSTAKAYALIKNIRLCIWKKNEDNSLSYIDGTEIDKPSQEIHLLHTGDYTHFNLLIKKLDIEKRIDQLTDNIEKLEIDSKKASPASSSSQSNGIAHTRGVHFYKEFFRREARKSTIELHRKQDSNELPRTGLYSSATHELAKLNVAIPTQTDRPSLIEHDKKLSAANLRVVKALQGLQKSKHVSPCLGTSSSSRKTYTTRYHEYVQRYVNSYQQLMSDMKRAPSAKIDERSSKRTQTKWTILKKLGFTKLPLVSTSESIYWGLDYATALLNWDRTETHLPRAGKVSVLSPCYQPDGHPRHPYLGILYVTLHASKDITEQTSTRILELFAKNDIDVKCSSPGGPLKGGYIKARERVFIGGIEKEFVKLSLVIRVPSFYHPYRPFIKEKYGIDKTSYNYFKGKLSYFGKIDPQTHNMKNKNEFNRIQHEIINYVITHLESIIERKIRSIAEKNNMHLRYLGNTSHDFKPEPLDLDEFTKLNAKSKRRAT